MTALRCSIENFGWKWKTTGRTASADPFRIPATHIAVFIRQPPLRCISSPKRNYDADEVELIEMENEELRGQVNRHRGNIERLVEMLTAVTEERDWLRKEGAAKGKTSLVMRIGEMSSISRNNQQLYQQNRHLQDTVVRLAAPRNEPPPF